MSRRHDTVRENRTMAKLTRKQIQAFANEHSTSAKIVRMVLKKLDEVCTTDAEGQYVFPEGWDDERISEWANRQLLRERLRQLHRLVEEMQELSMDAQELASPKTAREPGRDIMGVRAGASPSRSQH
jgi:hypothetical protein